MEVYGYIALIGVGLLLGILGGGGSILSVPILVYLFAEDVVMASAYSLFIVGITSMVGSIVKYKAQLVDLKVGFIFGLPSIVAIFSTRKWIIPAIPDLIWQIESFEFTKRVLILEIFAILMVLASISMINKKSNLQRNKYQYKYFYLVVLGIITGFLTGLVGAGGGFIIIPVLVFCTKLSFKTAVGTALFIISINSLVGFAGDVLNYTINWEFLLTITSLAIMGILVGSQYAKSMQTGWLQKTFGWFTLIMGSGIFLKEIFF
jgi:uncharacterized protein